MSDIRDPLPVQEPEPTYPLISISDIPAVVEKLKLGLGNPRYAVLMFVPTESQDGEHVNLQYAVEKGKVGLEWVLLGEKNIEDQDEIFIFSRGNGYEIEECEMNSVRYLRTEGPGLDLLGMAIMTEIYQLASSCKVKLLAEGFHLPMIEHGDL